MGAVAQVNLRRSLRNRSLRELMRAVPRRQLVPLWSAIFFTFAMLGFVLDVLARGRYPLPLLAAVVISSGLTAVAAVYAGTIPNPTSASMTPPRFCPTMASR